MIDTYWESFLSLFTILNLSISDFFYDVIALISSADTDALATEFVGTYVDDSDAEKAVEAGKGLAGLLDKLLGR